MLEDFDQTLADFQELLPEDSRAYERLQDMRDDLKPVLQIRTGILPESEEDVGPMEEVRRIEKRIDSFLR